MRPHLFILLVLLLVSSSIADDRLRRADFSSDPEWDAFRNRLVPDPAPITRQHFGHRDSNHARGKAAGEIGGRVQRSITPATYARVIEPRTLKDRMTASGRFSVTQDESSTGTCFGWFNKDSRGWRTPNSLWFRIDGNGGKFWVFFEYGTSAWRTGGMGCFEGEAYQRTKTKPFPADGTPHDWSLTYDPDGKGGRGEVTFVLGERHKDDGATFDRFGISNQQITGGGADVWLDNVVLDGEPQDFTNDPKWEATGNEIEFADRVMRPHHDFGFTNTHRAGGKAAGEIGGIIWRDEKPAYYADAVGPLSLKDELTASGKLAFTGAGSDSAVWIGWFDSKTKREKETPEHGNPQPNQLGIMLEGPSRIGHYFRPGYRDSAGEGQTAETGPIIRPDAKVHEWEIRYRPDASTGAGTIVVTFDGKEQELKVSQQAAKRGATFDRFGIFNVQSGGHFVEMFVDDVEYTAAP